MGKKLEDKTKHWMGLERATFEQRAIAEEYYDNELMRLIVKEFILHNKDKIYEKADYMILSVGTSYEPLVLNISLFQPKKILFLYTEKTEVTIDKIVDFCALPSSAYQKELVNEVNPLDIYKQIKDAYLQWHTPDKIYIDFTGGTKAMSAAAAMVGAVIDLQLIYIGSENYLPDFRKPLPGSETLYFINNPYTVFGDFEIEKAMQLFEQYNYSGAKNKLGELYEKIPDPVIRQQLHFSYLLAETYEHWDALEFEQSYNDMDSLVKELHRDMKFNPQFLLMDCIGILHEQLKILDALKDIQKLFRNKNHMAVLSQIEYIMPLMFTMQANALIREEQEKYDSATLLLYRLLEMAGQRRLSIYGIDVSGADFLNIKYNIQQLPEMKDLPKEKQLELYKEKIVKIKTQVFGRCNSSYMPEQISLLDGFIHLSALNDSIMTMGDGNCINKLKRLRSVVYLRNNSIFAHGFSPVSKTDYEKFKLFVIELFKQLCILEKIDYTEYCEKMKWVNPAYTKNYSMGGETLPVIYVKEQGAYLKLKGGQIAVLKGKERLLEIPLHSIDNVMVMGNVQVTTQALLKLLANGTDISYFTYGGKYIGHTVPERSKNIFLRFAQYELYNDEARRLSFAKTIVENKVRNQINIIKGFHWERENYDYKKDVNKMQAVIKTLGDKNTNNEVMGIEGLCSNIYFQCFRHMLKCAFNFENRNRRPPRDPVNALLSLAYTFLTKDMCTLIEGESFEAYLGFLHGIRYGRKSLALDMIEEWRQPVADRLVLTLFNKKMITQNDFNEDTGDGVFLNDDGFKKFCNEYERWLSRPAYQGKSFRFLMKQQIAYLKKAFENGGEYVPFLYKT